MRFRWLVSLALFFVIALPGRSAEAVFGGDGQRVWFTTPQPGSVCAIDVDDREEKTAADRFVGIDVMGGPKEIRGLALSKKGNLLMVSADAVWALDPKSEKIARVVGLPAGFHPEDLAYQETTGGILVWGSLLREDATVERSAAYWVARGSDKPEPVVIDGVEGWQAAAFDAPGHLYLGKGPDLWGGALIATEHEQAADFAWQIRAFRIAALGTPVAGETSNAGALIHSIAPNGARLIVTMRGPDGGTMLSLPRPLPLKKDGSVDRLLDLKSRWAFQQKVITSIQFVGAPNSLPPLPLVAVHPTESRIVYQTAAPGMRRWWVLEKSGKPRLMAEESD